MCINNPHLCILARSNSPGKGDIANTANSRGTTITQKGGSLAALFVF